MASLFKSCHEFANPRYPDCVVMCRLRGYGELRRHWKVLQYYGKTFEIDLRRTRQTALPIRPWEGERVGCAILNVVESTLRVNTFKWRIQENAV